MIKLSPQPGMPKSVTGFGITNIPCLAESPNAAYLIRDKAKQVPNRKSHLGESRMQKKEKGYLVE